MTGWIGITLGDPTGIGPEVALKALAQEAEADDTRYLLLGDGGLVERLQNRCAPKLPILTSPGPQASGRFACFNPLPHPLPADLQAGSALAAHAAVAALREGARRCLRGELDALVTGPVNKEAIIRAGCQFAGQTEFLSELAGTTDTIMMLLGADDRGRWLRVALATTHLALKDVAHRLTQAKVELAIERAARACRDLLLPRARVGVCGLNPHAGEGGEFGDEEITTVRPAVEACRRRGLEVAGPFAADTLFYHAYRGDYEAVVAMYHDQGLAPLKMVAFEHGVNWTLGLPFIRTAPDHGTAYDIAGRGVANPSSMRAAIRLAKQLAQRSAVQGRDR